MDVLANVLELAHLSGHAARGEFRAPWGLRVRPRPEAAFVHVTRGTCVFRMRADRTATRLGQGDVLLVPHGAGHELSDAAGSAVLDFEKVMQEHVTPEGVLHTGGRGETCCVVWGAYCFESRMLNPFLEGLPPSLVFRAEHVAQDPSLSSTLQLLALELLADRPGKQAVSRQLVDVLFVQMIRHWVERQPEDHGGWLLALRDGRVRRVLSRMHEEPAGAWTVDTLAREAAMSRAAFAKRFTELVGQAPGAYLTSWRMRLAANLLRTSQLSVAQVANRVGYESEFSFSRAFRREWDDAPSHYRKRVTAISWD